MKVIQIAVGVWLWTLYLLGCPFLTCSTIFTNLLFLHLIRFFHKISSLPAPGTDSEKLIWNALEAERPGLRQLEGKSLVEVNRSFLEKHNDSLMHRVAAAEMMYLLEPEKKLQAIGLIEDSVNNTVSGNGVLGPVKEGKIQDCIRVHRLLKTVFGEQGAAERWKARCAQYFPYCTYFGGIMSAITTNSVNHSLDIAPENGLPSQQVKTKDEEGLSLNGSVHVVDGMNNLSIR